MDEITSKQLLLLCELRKKPIIATNLKDYNWTYRHYDCLIRKKLLHLTEDETKKEIENISKEFPIMEIKERIFISYELPNLDQWSLSDKEEDMSWYQPNGYPAIKDWRYDGLFKLKEQMTERENYFLKQYASQKLD
ncbi:MAG: hypothetical protein WCO35_04020 [Candidatus Nomurabacteria bacterium]